MKHLKHIFIIFIVCLSISCNEKDKTIKTIDFTFVKDIELPLVDDIYNMPQSYQFYKTDSCLYMCYYYINNFFVYNINNQKLVSNFNFENINIIETKFINLDSIIFLTVKNNFNYDSTIFLADYKGNIKKNYSVKNMPLLSSENNFSTTDSVSCICNSNLDYSDNKIIIQLSKFYYGKINDSMYLHPEIPLSLQLNLRDNSFKINEIYDMPRINKNCTYNKSNKFNFSASTFKNYILYSFWYTPTVFRYNVDSKEVDSIEIKSFLINKEIPLALTNNDAGTTKTQYFEINEFKEKNIFLRLVILEGFLKKYGVIILDNNLNVLGEAVLPVPSGNLYFDGDLVYLYNMNKTFETTGKLVFSVYKTNFKDIKLSEFIENNKINVEEKNDTNKICKVVKYENNFDREMLKNYLNKKLGSETYSAFIVPVTESCHTCVDYLLKTYFGNMQTFSKSNVYLIAIGDNIPAIKSKLKEFNIPISSSTVIIDTSSIYKEAIENMGLEHLFIVKENKLIHAQSYYPDGLDSMVTTAFESIGIKIETKK